jgi:hypothetical protein
MPEQPKAQPPILDQCPPGMEYYCEYVCSGGGWFPVRGRAQPGYYCPDVPPSWCEENSYLCIDPVKQYGITADKGANEDGATEAAQLVRMCVYDYDEVNDRFVLSEYDCEGDQYCPPDPIAYAKVHGKLLMFPASMQECIYSGHRPSHSPAETNLKEFPKKDLGK